MQLYSGGDDEIQLYYLSSLALLVVLIKMHVTFDPREGQRLLPSEALEA